MKKYLLLIAFILAFPVTSHAAFGYKMSVTTNHLKVVSTQTNFPVLATTTNANLRTTGNGGHVQNINGYDIWCYSDSALTTRIACEREKYVATTGEFDVWILVSSLSSSADNVVYLAYGDASVSTDPNLAATYGATSVWDSNYKVVYHMNDNAANTTILDSTANANNATNQVNTSTKTITGQIASGLNFPGASDHAASGAFTINNAVGVTFSLWFKSAGSAPATGYGRILERAYQTTGFLGGSGTTAVYSWITNGTIDLCKGGVPVAGTWQYLSGTYDGTTQFLYLNGAQVCTHATPSSASNSLPLTINAVGGSSGTDWDGGFNEVRVSSTPRTANWITTEYNNQSNVGTFITYGTETPIVTSSFIPRLIVYSRLQIWGRLLIN